MCLHPTPVQSESQHIRLWKLQFLSSFWFDKKDRFLTAYASIGRYYFDKGMLEHEMLKVVFHQRMILTLIGLWWPELGCQFLLLFLPFGRPLAWQFTIIMVFLHLDFRFDHMTWPMYFILIVLCVIGSFSAFSKSELRVSELLISSYFGGLYYRPSWAP